MRDITENQVIEAIQAAMDSGEGDPNGITPPEIYDLLRGSGIHMSLDRIRSICGDWVKAGKAERVRVKRRRWDDQVYTTNGVVLTPKG